MAIVLVALFHAACPGQVFVVNANKGTIGKYTAAGATLKAALISGLVQPEGIAVDGNGYLYVTDARGTIGKYTATGSVINKSLISGLYSPWAIALDGNGLLFVANYGGSIGKYTTSGVVLNASLVSGLPSPIGIALDGKGNLFVSNYGWSSEGWIGSIGEYTTAGETVNAALISGLKWNWGLLMNGSGRLFVAFNLPPGRVAEFTTAGGLVNAFDTGLAAPTAMALTRNGHLLVADDSSGQIGEYTTAGEAVNPVLIAGLDGSRGLAVAVPPNSAIPRQGDRTVESGSSVRFAVSCQGTCPLTYQWYRNGTHRLGSPTNNPVLDMANVQPAQSGAYTVVVTNAFGAVTGAPAMLNVIAPVPRRTVPGISVTGKAGSSLVVDCASSPWPTNIWTPLGSVNLSNASAYYFDVSTSLPAQRYYRTRQIGAPGTAPALDLKLVPAVTLTGAVGRIVRLDEINAAGPTGAWATLATVTLTNAQQLYFDISAPGRPQRLYRTIALP